MTAQLAIALPLPISDDRRDHACPCLFIGRPAWHYRYGCPCCGADVSTWHLATPADLLRAEAWDDAQHAGEALRRLGAR
jgi:hypothetical protein